ncbi:unnamed protein product [Rotaria sp. Silwood1]|nr:unnamed protein product [Rotaria sp. Silwood1]CAF1628743.1 unnamed protein product [Rotaria sp. Silwood1]CAF4996627.1 unnamed protein product [Rotaria sp. Silwood1]
MMMKNREHIEIMRAMEANFGLLELRSTHEFVSDLQSAGFTVEENRIISKGDIPCYQQLEGSDSTAISDMFQRSAKIGLCAAKLDIVTSMFFFLARKP